MTSQAYWKTREEQNLAQNLKTEKQYMRDIEDIYQYTMDQVQKEIDSFYARYAAKEGIPLSEAKKRVAKLDMEEYGRKAEKYVKEKNFSAQANEEMRLYNLTMKVNRLEMLKANIGMELVAGFDELEKYFGRALTERTLGEFERQAGILGNTVANNAAAASAIVNASFKNARFSDRIWMHQDLLKAELDKLLRRGLIQGRNPRELARQIRKVFGVSTQNAERLMRTELARVQTEAQKQSFEANGYEKYTFLALGNACVICKDINGRHFLVKEMMPGDNAPPMHPNCRCSTAAYMDRETFDRWLDSYKDHGLDFGEWKKKSNGGIANGVERGYNRTRYRNAFKAIPYKDYTEPMTKKHVRSVMKEMGVDYGKARITLDKSKELIGKGVFGYTNPNGKEIIFYPDAFMSREELVKTIGHEKVHHTQIKKYGPTNDTVLGTGYEREARKSEAKWWKDYQERVLKK